MKKSITTILMFFVILGLISLLIMFSVQGQAFAEESDASFYPSSQEIYIAHITDLHYLPLGHNVPVLKENVLNEKYSSFNNATLASSKLLVESSLYLNAALDKLYRFIVEGEVGINFLFVSGDITLNGEIQSHYEVANILRNFQNKVRNIKPNFQIFCTPGNHDLYSGKIAKSFEITEYTHSGTQPLNLEINRKDFSILYSGLGYFDYPEEDIDIYYESISNRINLNNLPFELPYGKKYITSKTMEGLNMKYQKQNPSAKFNFDSNQDEVFDAYYDDYEQGELSYEASFNSGVDKEKPVKILCIDDEIDSADSSNTGGMIFDNTKNWIYEELKYTNTEDSVKMAVLHHNVVPHFSYQDKISSEFVLYRWKSSANFLADKGVRYSFTGHMHATDVSSHISFNNNKIVDLQTCALSGFNTAIRIARITTGNLSETGKQVLCGKAK